MKRLMLALACSLSITAAAAPPVKTTPTAEPAPIQEVRLQPSDSTPGTGNGETKLIAGRFTVFKDSGEKTIWDVTPIDSSAMEALITDQLPAGAVAFGQQNGDTKPGRYKIPDGAGVYIVYAMPAPALAPAQLKTWTARFIIKAYSTETRKLLQQHRITVTVDGTAPIPIPVPTPTPTPVDPPAPPAPANGSVDAALLAKIKAAVAKDAAEYGRWRGEGAPANAAEALTSLASVYDDTVAIMTASSDPALQPSTWGEVVTKTFNFSRAKKIPPLPALQNVRNEIEAYVGKYDTATKITADMNDKILKTFPVVAATLKEAAK